MEDFFLNQKFVIQAAIESLLCHIPTQAKGKFLYPLQLAQRVHAQLYSTFLFISIIIIQLLSACLKSELHVLPVSEMGKIHTLQPVTKYLRLNLVFM